MSAAGGAHSAFEERIVLAVAEGRDELVGLAGDLIAFDTTARNPGDPARDEAALQEYLRARLAPLGATTDVWEPESTGSGNRFVPDDLDFGGGRNSPRTCAAREAAAASFSTVTSTPSPPSPRSAGRATPSRPKCATAGCTAAGAAT